MKKLLLIVDAQNQFMPDGKLGEKFSEKIETLQGQYKYVAISQFINNPDTFWSQYLKWNKMMEGDKESNALAFTPHENAFIFKSDTFSSVTQEFLNYFDNNSIDEIHLCGADTDACVLATAFDLWDKKLHFKILIDYCVSSAGELIHTSAHHLMNKNFGFDIVVTSDSLSKHS